MTRVELNAPAPGFTLPDFNQHPVSLSDFKGRRRILIVLNRGFM